MVVHTVTEKDVCGCPNKTECQCNPELCPKASVCPNCTTAVPEFKNMSVAEACEGCCPTYRCVQKSCPKFNKEGYIRDPNSSDCCPKWICDSCVIRDGTIKQVSKEGAPLVFGVWRKQKTNARAKQVNVLHSDVVKQQFL